MQIQEDRAQAEPRYILAIEIIGASAAAGLFFNMGFGASPAWCAAGAALVAASWYGWMVVLPGVAFRRALRDGTLLSQIDATTRRRIFFLTAETRGKHFVRRHIRMNRLSSTERVLTDVV